jgi:hypothetical protein
MPISAPSQQAHIMYTANESMNWTINPNLLNQTTLAWYHGSMGIVTLPIAARSKAPDFNVPRYFSTATDSAGLIPSISMSQGYAGIAVAWPQNISHYTFEFIDNLSYIHGRHVFKFGGTVSRDNKTQDSSNINNNGTFAFNGGVTGDSLADLLLGRAFSYTETSDHKSGSAIFTDLGLYAQDQFRANARLSITMGMRWEYFQPEHANDGLATYFDPARFDATKASQVLPNGEIVLGTQNFGNGVVVACDKTNPFGCAITNSTHNVFDPRVGFSYQLTKDGRTVLRGGYGIFHDRWAQYISSTRNNYPINQNISIYNTLFSNPAQGTRRIFPGGFTSENSPWKIPSLQKWSMDLQRQLPGDLVLQAGYVASKGSHVIRTIDQNQPRANVAIANGSVSPNALRPYLGFASITSYQTTANSVYHSLQASGVRRFGGGFSVQASYTWSKSIDDNASPFDIYSPYSMLRGLSSFDRRHMFVASYIWEIPFGKKLTGWQKRVVAGWQISGISSFQTGNPFTVGISPDRAGTGGSGQRADVIGPLSMPKQLTQWFSTATFAMPALGAFGNEGRNVIVGPGINDWDISFSKRTAITEKMSVQFRAEFFNLFNHPQWSGIGSTYGSATFGQITSARDPRIGQLGLRLLW